MNGKTVGISVVVPVFNSAICLEQHVLRTSKVMQQMNKSFEIILVDDGSTDASWEAIKQLKVEHQYIVGIKLARNYGQQNATLCGINHAKGDWVITIDDDLEYPPETIPDLFQKQAEGDFDVVYGAYRKKKHSVLKDVQIKLARSLSQTLDRKNILTSSFRLIRKEIARKLIVHNNWKPVLDEYLSWYSDQIECVSIQCEKSKRGGSRYSYLNLIRLYQSYFLINPTLQLKIVKNIGATMAFFNLIYGIWIIYKKIILSIHVPGYTSIIVTVLFSSGLIILSIGIIAENMSRLIKMNYQQPLYTIDKITE
jgi:glycosyltransferase involved in cell wall biosynthesis